MKDSAIRITFGVTLGIAVLFLLTAPLERTSSYYGGYKAKTLNNMRQVGMALGEFESEYGHFPTTDIPEILQQDFGYTQQQRSDSNYILGQLIACQLLDTEDYFATPGSHIKTTRGDDIITPYKEILKAGECHLTYIGRIDGEAINSESSSVSSQTPLLFAYLDSQTRKFDPLPYRNKTPFFKIDGSVSEAEVNSKGQSSKPALLPEHGNSVWGNHIPTLHSPLKYNINRFPPQSETLPKLAFALIITTLLIFQWRLLKRDSKNN